VRATASPGPEAGVGQDGHQECIAGGRHRRPDTLDVERRQRATARVALWQAAHPAARVRRQQAIFDRGTERSGEDAECRVRALVGGAGANDLGPPLPNAGRAQITEPHPANEGNDPLVEDPCAVQLSGAVPGVGVALPPLIKPFSELLAYGLGRGMSPQLQAPAHLALERLGIGAPVEGSRALAAVLAPADLVASALTAHSAVDAQDVLPGLGTCGRCKATTPGSTRTLLAPTGVVAA